MAVEEPLTRIRQVLEERLGMEAASYLMDRPPGGWSNLVTVEQLDVRLELVRRELREEISLVRMEMIEARSEMREEFARFRGEMEMLRGEMAGDRGETAAGFAAVRGEMEVLRGELHKGLARFALQMSAVMVAGMAVMGAFFGLMSRV